MNVKNTLLLLILLTFTVFPIAFVKGNGSEVNLTAYTSNPPTIDGIMSPSEWDDADTINFVTPYTGGASEPINHTLYVMNDCNNLYLAIKRYDYHTAGSADWVTFFFDNDNDGLIETSDDVLRLTHSGSTPAQGEFRDLFYIGATYAGDDQWQYEGTIDGEGAMGTDGTIRIFELSHPLNSGDYGYVNSEQTEEGPHDFSLTPGDILGFNIESYDDSHDLGDWPIDSPSGFSADWASGFGDITIAQPPPIPTIESCNPSGNKDDQFYSSENIYVVGSGYEPSKPYLLYIVEDTTWTEGMAIPTYVAYKSFFTDSSGNTGPSSGPVWLGPLPVGEYDIVVDVNGNGVYDECTDALDDFDVESAGFFVVPEVVIGSIMAVAAMFAALGLYTYKKKQTTKQ